MKLKYGLCAALVLCLLCLTSCSGIGEKAMNLSLIYMVTFLLSLLLTVVYLLLSSKKDRSILMMLCCVMLVNGGYLWLSLTPNLNQALMANRLSYLGSAFLPAAIAMILLQKSSMPSRKWLNPVLLTVAAVMFLMAATPGITDIYYREVYLEQVNGISILRKVYGPCHKLYLVYLLGHFALSAFILIRTAHHRSHSLLHTFFLFSAVFINMGVWLLEQLVHVDFELLSVSYIISEMFLISLDILLERWPQTEKMTEIPVQATAPDAQAPAENAVSSDSVAAQLSTLTPAERTVYTLYTEGKTSRDIMAQLNITENTLKYHNRNIYSKLGVSSRKEMLCLARQTTEKT